MEQLRENRKKLYESSFNPLQYLHSYYDKLGSCDAFILDKIHNFFEKEMINGTLLEIGSGPGVHRLASASRFCDMVVSSDYLEMNREVVKKWIRGEIECGQLRESFWHIAKLEGYSDLNEGKSIIEERIKNKLSDVIFCDVYEAKPIGNWPHVELFDVILSCGCLESACTSFQDFKNCIRNVSSLLKAGGWLLLMGYNGADFYTVAGEKFPVLKFSINELGEALREADLEVMEMEEISDKDGIDGTNGNTSFFSISKKT